MSKGIIVVDKIPETCIECKFSVGYGYSIPFCKAKGEFAHTDKPSWCPIRPMLKKSEIDPLGENSYLAGWNDCISYIEDN